MLTLERQVMVFETVDAKRVDNRQIFDHSVTIVEQNVVMFNGEPIAHSMPTLSREIASYIEVD